jgi:cytochrome c oxidase subunit 2
MIAFATWPVVCIGQLPDNERGERIYDICGACHGPRGQGEKTLSAPPLAGQQPWYLLRQLRNFHSGVRGAKGDAQAREMRQILTTVSAESDWQYVIDFVITLPRSHTHEESDGDVGRGQAIYGMCASCHGSAGEGNQSLDAPRLATLPGWYIEEQLRKFRAGLRGGGLNDEPGKRMQAIASALHSEGDVRAVASYIQTTLGQ